MEKVQTKNAPAAIGPYSQAIKCGKMIFLSGQIPINPLTGEIEGQSIEEQTHQVCKNIEAILNEANVSFNDVVKTTCFLSDMNNFKGFNEVYGMYFTNKPARSCVAVKEIPKGVLCEVECVVYNENEDK